MALVLKTLYLIGFLVLLLQAVCSAQGTEGVQQDDGGDADSMYYRQEADKQDDDADSMHYLQEAHEQQEDEGDDAKEQLLLPTIYSGNTIALQTTIRYRYASCSGGLCGTHPCPRIFMNGADWTRCWGEVFRIYRRSGAGAVRVGDYVGIFYPRQSRWLGCAGARCGKAPCPGHPTLRHGFQTPSRWHSCWGEVFRIYARGKPNRAIVRHNDDIMLYYPRDSRWLSHPGANLHKHPCPGLIRPPSFMKYDQCWGEVFNIKKRGFIEAKAEE